MLWFWTFERFWHKDQLPFAWILSSTFESCIFDVLFWSLNECGGIVFNISLFSDVILSQCSNSCVRSTMRWINFERHTMTAFLGRKSTNKWSRLCMICKNARLISCQICSSNYGQAKLVQVNWPPYHSLASAIMNCSSICWRLSCSIQSRLPPFRLA